MLLLKAHLNTVLIPLLYLGRRGINVCYMMFLTLYVRIYRAVLMKPFCFPTVSPTTVSITGNRVFVATGTSLLTLTCTTGSSNPLSSITWYNGTNQITNDHHMTVTDGQYNGKVSSHVIHLYPTRYDDNSNITCTAGNSLSGSSSVSHSVLLRLNCE